MVYYNPHKTGWFVIPHTTSPTRVFFIAQMDSNGTSRWKIFCTVSRLSIDCIPLVRQIHIKYIPSSASQVVLLFLSINSILRKKREPAPKDTLFSHNHGSGKWAPPIVVTFQKQPFSTSMIMGGRVTLVIQALCSWHWANSNLCHVEEVNRWTLRRRFHIYNRGHYTNPNFMHSYFREIPQNYHRFVLFDSPQYG